MDNNEYNKVIKPLEEKKIQKENELRSINNTIKQYEEYIEKYKILRIEAMMDKDNTEEEIKDLNNSITDLCIKLGIAKKEKEGE